MSYSTQATSVSVILGITAIATSVISVLKDSSNTMSAFSGLLSSIITGFIIVYDLNCLTTGGCTIWSWLRAIVISIFSVFVLYLSIVSNKKDENKVQ